MCIRRRFTTLLLVSLGLAAPGLSFGQDGELEEILVTARKVGESIQDIPLSITAFGAEDISKQQIVDIEDIAKFTPGLHMSNRTGNRNDPALRFRGMDPPSEERQRQLSSAFVDGIYLPGTSQWVSMNDIERVEVVKGPQSAFFGRATFGGAVNFITKTPGNEWGGDVQLIGGNYGRADLWASVEGPIIEDKLAFRASGRLYTYDGAWDNPFPGSERLGAQETSSGSFTLFASPTDNLSIKLRHVYNEDRDGLSTQWLITGVDNNCGPFTTNGVTGTNDYYCGTLTRDLVPNLGIDTSPLEDTSGKSELGLERFVNMTSLDISWDIGNYTFSSLTGFYTDSTKDLRELLTDQFLVYLQWEDESFSQEFRLASSQEERLRWMVGFYYLDLEYNKNSASGFLCPGTGPFCGPNVRGGPSVFGGVNSTPSETVENTALFGSLSYDITDQLTVSLELRRAEEDQSTNGTFIQEAPPLNGVGRPFGGTPYTPAPLSFSATTPRVIFDYRLNDDTTLYASYSEGNAPGSYNQADLFQIEPEVALPAFFAEVPGIELVVNEAKLQQYEFGVKHSLASGKGYINAAAYFLDWTDQVFRGFIANRDTNGDGIYAGPGSPIRDRIGGQIDYNGNGNSEILGLELAASYALSENWRASIAYNYNKTELGDYEDNQLFRVFGTADARGREIARSPVHSGSVGVDFNMPSQAWGGGDWFARWDSYYQSKTYTWVMNLASTEAAVLHNVRGGWRNDRYSVMAWIENLADDDSVLASARTTGSFLTGDFGFSLSLPEPRTFGVTLQARFGE